MAFQLNDNKMKVVKYLNIFKLNGCSWNQAGLNSSNHNK